MKSDVSHSLLLAVVIFSFFIFFSSPLDERSGSASGALPQVRGWPLFFEDVKRTCNPDVLVTF